MHAHLGVNFSPQPGVSQFTSYEVTARLMLYVSMAGFLDLTVFREDARFNLRTRQAEPRNSTRFTLRSRHLDLLGADAYLAARPVFPFGEGAFCSGSFSEERPVETPKDERREIDDIVRTRPQDGRSGRKLVGGHRSDQGRGGRYHPGSRGTHSGRADRRLAGSSGTVDPYLVRSCRLGRLSRQRRLAR
jgi:hypothetical protein